MNIVFKQDTEKKIANNLSVAKRVFTRLIENQTQRLSEKAYILSSDFGFKQVIATEDRQTILSALDNLLLRIDADVAVLVSLEHQVLADSAHPEQVEQFFAPEIIKLAEQQGFASSIVIIDGHPHQMVVTPLMAPDLKAWLCISFKISQIQIDELQQLTQSHISLLLTRKQQSPLLITSSLPKASSLELASAIQDSNWDSGDSMSLQLDEIVYISSVFELFSNQHVTVIAVLQKSLEEQLIPFYRLQWIMFVIAGFSLALAFIGSVLVSRSISRPVKNLVDGVRAVGKGDYDYRIKVNRADEIGELSSAFNEMATQQGIQETLRLAKESAESASQAKTNFLANMSHELRTPLNSILGYAQILKLQNFTIERQLKAFDTIEQSGRHLLNLINDILDLSKIEADQLQLQSTNFRLRDLINCLLDTLQAKAESKGLKITLSLQFHPSLIIYSDELRLRQVLMNLLDNAIKYTESGDIKFTVSQSFTGCFCFRVEDTGIGIESEYLDAIFTSFHQLHQTPNYIEGTGLGLAISKQLVELLGGKLKVTSRKNQGSQFWFELDLQVAKQGEDSSIIVTTDTLLDNMQVNQQKILIADDKTENRLILCDMLRPFGFKLAEADNGQDCFDKAIKWKPDLILMDSKMPLMDGLETSLRLRADAETQNIIIIAISANAFENHRQSCLKAGADDFIAKPIELNILLSRLAHYLDLKPSFKAQKLPLEHLQQSVVQFYPPKEDLENLLDCTQQGDIQAIHHLIKKIEQQSQNYIVFTEQVTKLAQNFQIKKIHALLNLALEQTDNKK